jgi:hypothetical protein
VQPKGRMIAAHQYKAKQRTRAAPSEVRIIILLGAEISAV